MSKIKGGLKGVRAGFIILLVLAVAVDFIQFIITILSLQLLAALANPAGVVVGVLATAAITISDTFFGTNITEYVTIFLFSPSGFSMFLFIFFALHLTINSKQSPFLIVLIFVGAFAIEIIPILNGFLWFWTWAVIWASRVSSVVNLVKKQ